MSAIDPKATARTGLPVKPARRRQTSSDPKDWLKPAPRVNSIDSGSVTRYTIFRPCVSLIGAAMTGPNARPRVYKERPKIAAVRDTWNCVMISGTAGV